MNGTRGFVKLSCNIYNISHCAQRLDLKFENS